MKSLLTATLVLLSGVAPISLVAQVPYFDALVASAFPNQPAATGLFIVDASGQITAVSRFAGDQYPPLAVRIDAFNQTALLAVDLGNGQSRVLRIGISGATAGPVTHLADVPGRVNDLIVVSLGEVLVSIGGSQGALLALPRNGGTPRLVTRTINANQLSTTRLSAEVRITELGQGSMMPGNDRIDTATNQRVGPRVDLSSLPSRIVGAAAAHGAFEGLFVGDASGGVWRCDPFGCRQIAISNPFSAGGIRAIRSQATTVWVLGNSTSPHLAMLTYPARWVIVTRTIPGDPIAFDIQQPAGPVSSYGTGCSTSGTPPTIDFRGGLPRRANRQFALVTSGQPMTLAILAFGASDHVFGGQTLPLQLPGSLCPLQVAPDATPAQLTDANGAARVPIPIPNDPALNRTVWFAQWIHASRNGRLETSSMYAINIW